MSSPSRATGAFLLLTVALLLSGCVTTSIVKQPGAASVKSVAIVSVYSNTGLRNEDGDSKTGQLSSWSSQLGLAGNDAQKDPNAIAKALDFGGTRLVEYAYGELTKELGTVQGWNVVAIDQFASKPAFQKFHDAQLKNEKERLGIFAGMTGPLNVHHPKTPAYYISHVHNEAQLKELSQLAQDLGVDAVAVLALDIAYSASNAIGGTGTAKAAVGSSLHVVNKKGELAVSTLSASSGLRMRSDDSMGMVAGEILYNDSSEKLFKQAIQKSASYYGTEIQKDLKKG